MPSYATALYRRGMYEQAIRGLESMPDDDPFVIQSRAFLLMATGNLKEAKAICLKSLSEGQKDGMIFDCLFLLGLEDKATQQVRSIYRETKPSKYWPLAHELMRYRAKQVVGEEDEEDLVELAGDSERDKAEVHWIIGVRRLAQGNRQGAQKSFNEIASSPMYVWSSVIWARAFAERMNDPNWLDWLPSKPVERKPK